MMLPPYLLLPLMSALGYAVAALFLKRAMAFGVGPWRISFFSNLMMGVLFVPLLAAPEGGWAAYSPLWYQPVVIAAVFLSGNVFTFLALSRGDVSVATPILGMKVVFVAVFSVVLFREQIPGSWWIAAVLAGLAVGLLRGETPSERSRLGVSIGFALIAAGSFAMNDVLVQEWAPEWGFRSLIPVVLALVSLFSFGFIPFFRESIWTLPASTWKWLAPGGLFLALQALALTYAVAVHGHATAANIAYNTRGLWSVLLVLVIGSWFDNEEKSQGRGAMGRRLFGACLMLAAVALVAISGEG